MNGDVGTGSGLPIRAHTGTILTMTTTNRAGQSMKATGVMKITVTTTTGITGSRLCANDRGLTHRQTSVEKLFNPPFCCFPIKTSTDTL